REMLRAALDSERGYRRPGHRRDWIDEALEPIRADLDECTYRRLTANLSLYFGIDPIVVLETITELGRDQAIDALVWGATALARGETARAGAQQPGSARAADQGLRSGRPAQRALGVLVDRRHRVDAECPRDDAVPQARESPVRGRHEVVGVGPCGFGIGGQVR